MALIPLQQEEPTGIEQLNVLPVRRKNNKYGQEESCPTGGFMWLAAAIFLF
jgi:hypothetical protein